MATFYYRAVTAAGSMEQGVQEGASEKDVARKLQSLGLVPVHVGPSQPEFSARREGWLGSLLSSSGTKSWSSLASRRVTSRDRLLFTQELSTLLNAGVPLDRALSICLELTESKAFREIIADVLREVKSGKSLADALAAQGKVFSKLYVNMVRAGQAAACCTWFSSGWRSLKLRRRNGAAI